MTRLALISISLVACLAASPALAESPKAGDTIHYSFKLIRDKKKKGQKPMQGKPVFAVSSNTGKNSEKSRWIQGGKTNESGTAELSYVADDSFDVRQGVACFEVSSGARYCASVWDSQSGARATDKAYCEVHWPLGWGQCGVYYDLDCDVNINSKAPRLTKAGSTAQTFDTEFEFVCSTPTYR